MDIEVKEIREVDESLLNKLQDSFDSNRWVFDTTKKFVKNPNNYLFCAFQDDYLVGVMTAFKLDRTDKHYSEFLLFEIDVAEKFRRQGVGKLMIKKLLEVAREEGSYEVWVLTEKSNSAATRLYESTGGIALHEDDIMYSYKLKAPPDQDLLNE